VGTEDPETYIKRMRSRLNNEERRALWEKDRTRSKGGIDNRLKDIEHKRHNAEKEYQRRTAAQRAAAASAGTGAAASSCDATYPDYHDAAAADGLATISLALASFVAALALNRRVKWREAGMLAGWRPGLRLRRSRHR
jgi:hypothetical protein